jgi:L-threonylcarbamoyladenylate synthase
LNKKDVVSDVVTAGLKTVGIRIPNDSIVNEIISKLGEPIVASSANLSGEIPPTTAEKVYETLQGRIPLILDHGKSTEGVPSTIVDITSMVPRILREGPAPIAQILRDLSAF